MASQVLDGVFGGLGMLLTLTLGYFFYWTGGYLVNEWGVGSSELKGMPKWKAAIMAVIAGVVVGFLAATPRAIREGEDPVFGGGEVIEVIEVETPYEAFFSSFVFSCGAMWFGVAKSD